MTQEMECACIDVDYDGEPCECWNEKWITTRTEHVCTECGEAIPRGSKCHFVKFVCEDSWERHWTCAPCARIREQWYCHGVMIGGIRNDLKDVIGFDYVKGPLDNDKA